MKLTRKDFIALRRGADLAQAQKLLARGGENTLKPAILAGATALALFLGIGLVVERVIDAPGDRIAMHEQYRTIASNN